MPHHEPDREPLNEERIALSRLKTLLERMHAATGIALKQIAAVEEVKSPRWRCAQCGERYFFTKPCRAVACDKCRKCGGESFLAME